MPKKATNRTYNRRKKTISKIKAAKEGAFDRSSHLVVEALAGTGKTFTLIEGLNRLVGKPTEGIVGTPQQDAVWEAMETSKGHVTTAAFCAFNKSIAKELQDKVPEPFQAMTIHSLGNSAVRRAFTLKRQGAINKCRVQDIISELDGRDPREIRRKDPMLMQATEKLVGLCKMNLIGTPEAISEWAKEDAELVDVQMDLAGIQYAPYWEEELDRISSHYDVELNGARDKVYDLVPKVLERCKDVNRDGCIDFNDMIWIPVVLDLPVFKYDLLLVDEAQDLNRCQQQLAMKAGRRLILCGDVYQAIYGFAGADSDSIPNMKELLGETKKGVQTLPLTFTRRCGKAIVKEASAIVEAFEAFPENPEGKIGRARFNPDSRGPECKRCEGTGRAVPNKKSDEEEDGKAPCAACDGTGKVFCGSYVDQVQDGDFLLCRVNAPLVSQCFRFIKEGRKAVIQGRDIGAGLVSTVKKMKADDIPELVGGLSDWLHNETEKENRKRNPSESRLIVIKDRYDCLMCFCEDPNAKTIDDIINKIEAVFTDNGSTGVRLSSIHRAKGLEADRVFLLEPKGATVPHPMAKSKWQRVQEMNLRYVAITRAIEELVYVS